MRKRVLPISFLALPFVFGRNALAAAPNLASYDWSVKQAQSLNAESNDAVWKFMTNLYGYADLFKDDNIGKLCEFHFADLRHSGQLSLVASYDNGGTADCNDVEIFDKSPAGVEKYDFDTTHDFSFDGIYDINGDGHQELVVDTTFAAGGGIDHCSATWPVIYSWTGTGYSDVSSDYKSYYKHHIAFLQRENAAAEAQKEQTEQRIAAQAPPVPPAMVKKGSGTFLGSVAPLIQPSPLPQTVAAAESVSSQGTIDVRNTACVKAEVSKIERYLGISRDAGMRDAIKWAESDDPATRQFAARVLADIATTEATEDLQTLSNDPDRDVAMAGKAALARVKTPTVYPMIQGKLMPGNTGYPPTK